MELWNEILQVLSTVVGRNIAIIEQVVMWKANYWACVTE
jgi:hypothetical protein